MAQPQALPKGTFIRGGGYSDFFLQRDESTPKETIQAGDLFAALWKEATGRDPEIGPENLHNSINVGLGADVLTTDLFPKAARERIGSEGFYYATYTPSPRFAEVGASKYLVITGNNPASTLVGVYGFFRNAFDCEWFAPAIRQMRRPGFQMSELKAEVVPAFKMRDVVVPDAKSRDEASFRVAHGLRAVSPGAGFGRASAFTLIAPEVLLDSQPAFFAERNGQRRALKDGWQKVPPVGGAPNTPGDLCPSAAGLAEAIVASIREAIDTAPKADEALLLQLRRARAGWLAQEKVWALTPMEDTPCACAACAALAEREQSPMAPWLALVNQVAVGLDAAYPEEGYRVLIHAEGARRVPPSTLRPADNVVVMLFTNACDFSEPLAKATTPANVDFVDALERWSRLGDHIWVADYLGRVGSSPAHFGNLGALQENLQFYTQHHVEGVLLQAAAAQPHNDDFSALRCFLGARLLWDPDLDVEALTKRFFTHYYGLAAEPVRAYRAALAPHGVGAPGGEPTPAQREGMAQAQATLAASRGELSDAVWSRVKPLLPAAP